MRHGEAVGGPGSLTNSMNTWRGVAPTTAYSAASRGRIGSRFWLLPIQTRAVASTPTPQEPPLHPSLETRLPLKDGLSGARSILCVSSEDQIDQTDRIDKIDRSAY